MKVLFTAGWWYVQNNDGENLNRDDDGSGAGNTGVLLYASRKRGSYIIIPY